jgi:haloalkane dehalogenase
MLVPTKPGDPASAANRKAWEVLRRWEKPFLTAFNDGDAITRGGEIVFQQQAPGAQGQSHVTIKGAGHFLEVCVCSFKKEYCLVCACCSAV